ncbi:MAG: 4-hydroxy-tetrahydrodipicolinate reductase [Planctomycetes bacterium]|nr:4-hydroxy-tetrahydrodipicolinate reductase [Planctomycetota bacterium]
MTEFISQRKHGDAPETTIRLAVFGAAGCMGARTCALARDDRRFQLIAEIDRASGSDASGAGQEPIDVIIDFSSDSGARAAAALGLSHGAALVVGTTGLSRQTLSALDVASRTVPVMVAANTSVGAAVLRELATRAALLLGEGYDANLIEVHHVRKRDKPSGTALSLAELLREKAGVKLPPDRIHAIRSGDVVGEHTVEFAAAGERIKICHIATSRDLFARGALRAAAWLVGRSPGRYTVEQALGIAPTGAPRS